MAVLQTVAPNLRYALRGLARDFTFTATVIGTTGLGLGVALVAFTMLDSIALRLLPYPQPDRLVQLWEGRPAAGEERVGMSQANFLDLQRGSETLEQIALYAPTPWVVQMAEGNEQVEGALVTPLFFNVLGIAPAVGRTFGEGESARTEVILSHSLWMRRFGGDRSILGKSLVFENKQSYVIVGVMPAEGTFPRGVEMWVAELLDGKPSRNEKWRQAIGRLRADVPLDTARSEVRIVAERLAAEYPAANQGWTMTMAPVTEVMLARSRTLLWLFALTAGCVMLLTYVNVMAAAIGRAINRQRDAAVRRALGATNWRLARLWLAEGSLLGLGGGFLGILVAVSLLPGLVSLAPAEIPRLDEISLGWRQVVAASAVVSLAVVMFSVAPLMLNRDTGGADQLVHGGQTLVSGPRHFMRRGLIVFQTALTLTLVIAAGLLVRTFTNIQRVDLGFDPRHVVAAEFRLPIGKLTQHGSRPDWHKLLVLYRQIRDGVGQLPGVTAAAIATGSPLTTSADTAFVRLFDASSADTQRLPVQRHVVSPEFFQTMGLSLLAGRYFGADDRLDEAQLGGWKPLPDLGVAIVSRAAADRYWPGRSPLGQILKFNGFDWVERRQVIGVVESARTDGPEREPHPEVYIPLEQFPRFTAWLHARVSGSPEALRQQLTPALRAVDRDVILGKVTTMTETLARRTARPRFLSIAVSTFALLGLLLAGIGIYGFVAYLTHGRLQEIAVRMSFGATRVRVAWLVMREALLLAMLGIGLGLVAAWLLGRTMAGVLFEASPLDAAAWAVGVIVVLGAVALGALVPVRRALRIDPAVVLKQM